ncbi:high mobility group box domain-containing protein [Spinellus fusiger]|nr:high mobility group box domain-containing protein [Spinellus fusiger]
MINDNDEGHQEVKDFLVTCRLSQYVDCFIREGFDTLNSICEILEEDMIEMNVKRGHRRLIQREISTAKGIHPNQPLVIKSIRNSNNRDASSTSSPSNGTSGYGSMSSSSTLFTPNTIMTPKNPDTTDRGMEKHRVNADPVCISTILNDSGASSNEDDSIGAGGNYPPKRTYRRHPRQDVNAPVKPPSAYIMFSNDTRLQLKDKNYSFAELAKTVGDRWKSLSCAEKQAYERTAMRAKDEYAGMLSQYKRTVDYKKYQEYLKEFRSKQLTASRMVSRTRKRRTTESLNR